MENLLSRFLELQHIEPVYFITCMVDIVAIVLWSSLKKGLSILQRSLYQAVILVAFLLTAGVLCRIFGLIHDWKDLEALWNF